MGDFMGQNARQLGFIIGTAVDEAFGHKHKTARRCERVVTGVVQHHEGPGQVGAR